ncbi:exosome complex protein Rrp42 [Candidatus Woesearchaeota archaeon]|nr:exosome complex protein Rrp42 [Candidatus Woesearchaeota archaeon]
MNKASRKHIIELLDKGIRLDGRKPDQYREVSVEFDVTRSAEGSARVKIGDTEMITGVKMELFEPYPDTPDQGSLMVGAEFSPMASPEFESGPPGIESIELSRVIDRGIRESQAIDLKKLCLKKGELCWMVVIDMAPINAAGNLFDAGALSAIAAIKDTKLPGIKDDQVDYDNKTEDPLPVKKVALSVTVCKIGKHLIIDPLPEEEKVIDARLTVATDESGELCALQKGGEEPLSVEEIDKMVELGIEKGKELRAKLES